MVAPAYPIVEPKLLSFYGERIEHLDEVIPEALKPEFQEALLRQKFFDSYSGQYAAGQAVLVSFDSSFEEAVSQTQTLIADPNIRAIIGPALLWQNPDGKKVGVRCGALVRSAENAPWKMVHFLGSRNPNKESIQTLGLMVYLGRENGLEIDAAEVSFLSASRVFEDDDNPATWIESKNVIEEVEKIQARVPRDIEALIKAHGKRKDEVHPLLGHVSRLNGRVSKALQAYLEKHEIVHLSQIPDEILEDRMFSPVQRRQIRGVKSGEVIVEDREELQKAVARIFERAASPGARLSFLDFETVRANIAFMRGSTNRQMIVPQLSVRGASVAPSAGKDRGASPSTPFGLGKATWQHYEYITTIDPRDPDALKNLDMEIAQKLLEAVGDSGPILVWNKTMEMGVIRELAERLKTHKEPDLADKLEKILNDHRIVDLWPLVKDYIYAEEFGGSFSLKDVLSALRPDKGYSDLAEFKSGLGAAYALLIMLHPDTDPAVKEMIRKNALIYCGRDTLGTVWVLEQVAKLAGVEIPFPEIEEPEGGYESLRIPGTRRHNYKPGDTRPLWLSRSALTAFLDCPRHFYTEVRLGQSPVKGPKFNLNLAVDALYKKEFDRYRALGERHPLMDKAGIDPDIIPFAHDDLNAWRERPERQKRKESQGGIHFHHEPTNITLYGYVDDIWVNPKTGELHVVDYKSTSFDGEVTLDGKFKENYKRQVEIYQWILRNMGFKVSNRAFFVYANARTDREEFDGRLEFDQSILTYDGEDLWVTPALVEAKRSLDKNLLPPWTSSCPSCTHDAQTETILRQNRSKLSAGGSAGLSRGVSGGTGKRSAPKGRRPRMFGLWPLSRGPSRAKASHLSRRGVR
ncbi:MAG: DUF2779 domain-containing protein [Deltaproteobacteria bacterium]|nr:DUF2779 domain-containing protein [Deltaproteobacteria bacterium]